MRWFARSAFFVSGIAGLVFEIVWLRCLGLAVGATTLAVATTTAAYMGGLALGSHFGGRFADRLRRPLAVYGAVELAVGSVGALVPLACRAIPAFDEHWLAGLESGSGRALVRFAVSLVVLLIPTTAMGMTLPVLSRAVVAEIDAVGREVGTLYVMNIAGAVVGAALAGFVLIPEVGLNATNTAAVGLDCALGLAAIIAGLTLKPRDASGPAAIGTGPGAGTGTGMLRPNARLLLGLLVLTGAAAMALQVLWTRGLGTALGPSTYAFSAIVCAYLIGLALGGALAARIADRVASTRVALAIALLATALATWGGIAIIDQLPLILRTAVVNPNLTVGGFVRTEFALAALSLMPATAGMGTLFPLTIAAVSGSTQHVGATVGRAYALNTAGNIAGSFAAVFVLLPAAGVEWGMRLAALSYVAAALLLVVTLGPAERRWRRRLLATSAVPALALLLWPSWDVATWTSGAFRASYARAFLTSASDVAAHVVFHADGLASTVTVEEDSGVRWVKVNGKIDGSSEGDMPTQILSGLLPMLVHPSPKQVAVIGCGTCVTAGAALRASPDHLTLIELESEVLRAARLFADVNHEPWNDPRFSVVEDDGRNYLMRAGSKFDVIISEPSNPWVTGAASLFTLEFFRIAARRLAPGGMFLQWLQQYELAPERIASVLKTFNTVFPHVIVFSAHPDSNDLLLLGSIEPIGIDRNRLTARFAELAPELVRAEVHSIEDLLSLVLLTEAELARLPAATLLNTDDNAFIEFGAPKDLVAFAEDDPSLPLFAENAGKHADIVSRLGGIGDDPAAHMALAWSYLRHGMLADAAAAAARVTERLGAAASSPERRSIAEEALEVAELGRLLGEEEDREAVVPAAGHSPSPEYSRAADLLDAGKTTEALACFEGPRGRPAQNGAERLLYAYLLYKVNRDSDARRYWQAAQRDSSVAAFQPVIAYYLARGSYGNGAYRRAVTEMQQYVQLRAKPLSVSHKRD